MQFLINIITKCVREMFRTKCFTTSFALLLPILSFAGENVVKKTFFPGKSWYFWIFTLLAFYVIYIYKSKKATAPYLHFTFYKALIVNLFVLFLCFIGANIFIGEPD